MSWCDEARLETLLKVSVPIHMEFFNRLVERYPRTSTGLVGSIRDTSGFRQKEFEMFLLRSFAEFPLHIQRDFPSVPLLTERFKRNVDVVVSTLQNLIDDDLICEVVERLSRCDDIGSGSERDLSHLSTSQLWAVEVVRMEVFLVADNDMGVDSVSSLYELCAYEWLRGSLATFLDVEVVSGGALHARANAVMDSLLDFE
ncbi:hypothetical protein VNI00_018067 [Paramarasmius palmivorus]|uniref:Uncharacterized protein n=1 Tax=Paramarasmius palmivorus TaxID=297713 RepID=A0AAW0B1C9_9AGAR